ncbi:MAG: hypothetical protein ACR2NN_28380 [Bryobacteraceae bacterium]
MIFTNDLDFGMLLAVRKTSGPSVIARQRIRLLPI